MQFRDGTETTGILRLSELLLPGLEPEHATMLEDRLRAFVESRDLPLYRMMAYQMGWVDANGEPAMSSEGRQDRILGQFALAVAGALGSGPESAVDYALSVELAHNAALVHEDVEDGNTERSGRPSVWWTWGPAQAINAGDGMQAMARLSIFSMLENGAPQERVSAALEVLDEAVLSQCEGEYLDITFQERLSLTTEQYFEMVDGRAGSLFGGAGALGAIAHGVAGDDVSAAVRTLGRRIGAARQVRADVSALWGERDQISQGRLISKKKNLAIVYATENGDATLRRKLGELYMQRVLDPSVIDEVASLVDSAGGREFCQHSIDRLVAEGTATLPGTSLSGDQAERLVECARVLTSEK